MDRKPHRGWLTGLLVLLLAATAGYAIALVATQGSPPSLWVTTVAYALPSALAAVLAFATWRLGGAAAHAWGLIALALATDVLGSALVAVTADAPEGSALALVPDAAWLLFYPLTLAAVFSLARRRLALRVEYGWLDAVILAGAFTTAGLTVIAFWLPMEIEVDPAGIVGALYVAGDIALLSALAVVGLAFRLRMPATWWLLAGGLALYCVADTTYLVAVSQDAYVGGTLLDLAWPVSSMLIGVAAYVDADRPREARVHYSIPYGVPGAAILAAGVGMLLVPDGSLHVLVHVAAIVTIAFGTVRMTLAMRQILGLNERLRDAEIDPLTGLLSMRALRSIPADRVRGASLIILDIYRFSEVNIALGHEAGDRLLSLIADRLTDRLRSGDALFRIGSDGFAVFLPRTSLAGATAAAEGYINVLERRIELDGVPLHLTACGGVAAGSPDCDTMDLLFRDADAALILAKVEGAGLVHAFEGGTGARSAARLHRRSEIKSAFAAGGKDFLVYYQPIVRLHDDSVFGVEALVRWQHGADVLNPGEFMDDLVRSGSMAELTDHMLHTALRELRLSGIDIPVAVNVSPELVDDALLPLVRHSLEFSGSTPDQLLIEVTEESLMRSPEQAARVLSEVRNLGVRVELDDFGTGWSGLASLRDLAVDGIKIDRSFVVRILDDEAARAILDGLSVVASELDLLLVFEGVEDPDLLALLRAAYDGCVQGFGVGRPMPIHDLERWLSLRASA